MLLRELSHPLYPVQSVQCSSTLTVCCQGKADKLPVYVFVHGGGFQFGAPSVTRYGPDYLLPHGVVVVTVQYRLGALGNVAHALLCVLVHELALQIQVWNKHAVIVHTTLVLHCLVHTTFLTSTEHYGN